jgi:hypothetical protein
MLVSAKKQEYIDLGNFKLSVDPNKKIPPNNVLKVPMGELEQPITTGKELLEMINQCLNKERYKVRNRGRGSRKKYGNAYGISLDHAEWVAVYVENKQEVLDLEKYQLDRMRSRYDVLRKLRELSKVVYEHQQEFGKDVVVEQKDNINC